MKKHAPPSAARKKRRDLRSTKHTSVSRKANIKRISVVINPTPRVKSRSPAPRRRFIFLYFETLYSASVASVASVASSLLSSQPPSSFMHRSSSFIHRSFIVRHRSFIVRHCSLFACKDGLDWIGLLQGPTFFGAVIPAYSY